MTDLWYNTRRFRAARRGQAMLEYMLSLAGMLAVVAVLWGLVGAALRYADRTEDLVTSDCP